MKAERSTRVTKLLKCQPRSSWGSWEGSPSLWGIGGQPSLGALGMPWESPCSVRSGPSQPLLAANWGNVPCVDPAPRTGNTRSLQAASRAAFIPSLYPQPLSAAFIRSLYPQPWGCPSHLLCQGLSGCHRRLRGCSRAVLLCSGRTSSSASSLRFWITGNSDLERWCGAYFFQSYFQLMLSMIFREDPVSGCSTDSLLATLHVNRFYEMKAGCVSSPIQTECPVLFTFLCP